MQHMKDPAAGMPPQLLAHMHLISKHRYPVIANPGFDTIVNFLMEAPKIVRDIQPVQWQFLDCPQDGSLLLTWQPLEYLGTAFASDGYVWADAEQSFKSDVQGYTLEVVMHRSGYRASGEPLATHCRKRYRLLPGNPGLGLPTPDPSLWIVHYSRAATRDHIPSASIPLMPQVQASLAQRRAIQTQGQLARKEFMLHDRANWPVINLPQVMAGRPGSGPMTAGGGHRRGQSMNAPMGDPTIEEEEDVSRGDALDLITPREISRMRYEQHHEWMEEIVESAYNIKQIIPTDLGLGRKGELEALTRGFFEAPVSTSHEASINGVSKRVGRMDPGMAEEFAKMAAQKVADMQAELESLKQKHARRMEKLQQTSVLSAAEKRLRNSSGATEAGELGSAGDKTDSTSQAPTNGADEVVRDVEMAWGRRIDRVQNVAMVQRGGLEEPAPRTSPNLTRAMSGASPTKGFSGGSFSQTTPNTEIQSTPLISQNLPQQPPEPQQPPLQEPSVTEPSPAALAGQIPTPSISSTAQSVNSFMQNEEPASTSQDDTEAPVDSGADIDMAGLEDQDNTPPLELDNQDWVMVDEGQNKSPEAMESEEEAQALVPSEGEQETVLQAPSDTLEAAQETKVQELKPAEDQQSQPVEDQLELTTDLGLDTGDLDLQDEFDTAGDALAQYDVDGDDLDLDTMDDSAFGDAFHPEDASNDMED